MVSFDPNIAIIYTILVFCLTSIFGTYGDGHPRRKRALDRISSDFLKRSDDVGVEEKRRLDRLSSGFIKRHLPSDIDGALLKLEYYLAQNEGNRERTRDTNMPSEEEKRALDRVGVGLLKKRVLDRINAGLVKRRMDRLAMGLIKRDPADEYENMSTEKRRLDRIGSGFIKKDSDNVDKRYIDRMSSGLIKKQEQKRILDRINSDML